MLTVVCDEADRKTDLGKDAKNDERHVYIFFDFECTQDDLIHCETGYQRGQDSIKGVNCKKSNCGTFEHKQNVCVSHKVCSECFYTDVTPDSTCQYCGQNEQVFTGLNTVDGFCKWLFSGENNGATVLCHNFKGYDSFPILQYLFKNAIIPKIVPCGAKNMSVEVPACNIRMIDSMNFLPSTLSELPKMFGLEEMAKGFFPHLYNRKENQGTSLPHLLDIGFYNPDSMTTDPNKANNRKSFMLWNETHRNDAFNFNVELLKY